MDFVILPSATKLTSFTMYIQKRVKVKMLKLRKGPGATLLRHLTRSR